MTVAISLLVEKDDTINITLMSIYDKNEIQNVSDEYIKWLVGQIEK